MRSKEREKNGPFVITSNGNLDTQYLRCNFCDGIITEYTSKGEFKIPPEELLKSGNVPIPNFGWFCSQKCGNEYSNKFEVNFDTSDNGDISYY